jgi:hypothetical protein
VGKRKDRGDELGRWDICRLWRCRQSREFAVWPWQMDLGLFLRGKYGLTKYLSYSIPYSGYLVIINRVWTLTINYYGRCLSREAKTEKE